MAYLGDALIYSSDLHSHVALLQQVFSIFLKHHFYPKLRKCKFAQRELGYLGYTFGAEGIKPSKDKIQAILIWPEVLANETQVRQFLGTANYCRMFMDPEFANVARPLVELTKKGGTFAWSQKHSEAMRKVKKRLVEYTVLQIPDPTKSYQLYTDASGYAVGAVLEQNAKPVGFLSQIMDANQQKYSIYDQELLALVTALDKWKHLLGCAKVTAFTDHHALAYLQQMCTATAKPLRGRTPRWLDFLAEFQDLTITYAQGSRNEAADALSRHPQHSTTSFALQQTPINSASSQGILAVLISSATEPTRRYNTRGQQQDYRRAAGIRPRTNRPQPEALIPTSALRGPEGSAYHRIAPSTQQTENPGPSIDVEDPYAAGEALKGVEASPSPALNAGPFCPQAWEVAYSRCPVFNNPCARAKEQSGALVHLEFDNRRSAFHLRHHYLRICLNGLWRICVPTLPEFLSHVLYRHHDHVTAGHRGQRKTFQALSRHFYCPGMRVYATAYVESCSKAALRSHSTKTLEAYFSHCLSLPDVGVTSV